MLGCSFCDEASQSGCVCRALICRLGIVYQKRTRQPSSSLDATQPCSCKDLTNPDIAGQRGGIGEGGEHGDLPTPEVPAEQAERYHQDRNANQEGET